MEQRETKKHILKSILPPSLADWHSHKYVQVLSWWRELRAVDFEIFHIVLDAWSGRGMTREKMFTTLLFIQHVFSRILNTQAGEFIESD